MHFLHPFQKHSRLIVFAGLVVAIVSGAVSFVLPHEYRSDAQVLIISKTRTGVDPYTTVKSAERVGENISAVMETSDFFEKVRSQDGYAIDWSRFLNTTEKKRRKLWQKTIEPSVLYGTGVLSVSAYAPTAKEASLIAGASTRALVEQGWEYVGGDVTIKVINNPVATTWPARPHVMLNALAGFLAGSLLVGIFILARS